MNDVFAHLFMRDVYEVETDEIDLYLRRDRDDSLIVDPVPDDDGDFNVIIENREGRAYLVVWHKRHMELDPTFIINLTDGVMESLRLD